MDAHVDARPPWNPDPAWADPLIALLAVVVLLLSSLILSRRQAPAPAQRAGLQGRLAELPFAASKALPARRGPLLRTLWPSPGKPLEEPWDRAVMAVLRAEEGDREEARKLASQGSLPGAAAEPFRRCWAQAFDGIPGASASDLALAKAALGDGWAAAVLQARIDGGAGRDPEPALRDAKNRALRWLSAVALAGVLLATAGLTGAGFGIYLAVARPPRPASVPGPAQAPARALALVFLAWFLGLLAAGTLVSTLAAAWPALAPFALPLAYSLHAGWGTGLICAAQGLHFRALWKALTPGGCAGPLRWGAGFLALAVPAVLGVGLVAGPLVRRFAPPQQELFQVLAGLRSDWALLLTAVTVVILAPAFEELLFRGTLLPWAARRWGWTWGLLATSALFGMMHLHLAGLPTLTVLGVMLGLAFRRGGSLWAPILIHGLWNGGVFLFVRLLMA